MPYLKRQPRTAQPTNDNKCYLTPAGGGYNLCILGNKYNKYNKRPTKYSVLPNCVGYAFGRYLEYHGLTKANLPTCNAKDWYATAKARGFSCSQTPAAGAIVCFKGTTYGHVAFVERVEKNGDIFISESNWGHQIFRNLTLKKTNGYNYSSSLKLVGFIAPIAAVNPPAGTKKYMPGTYRVTADLLKVRSGPGTNYAAKTFIMLTENAREQIKAHNNGKAANGFVKGVTFTANETQDNWGKSPSGWLCLDYCKKL